MQSLVISDEDDGVAYVPSYEFHAVNLKDPILGLRMKYPNIQLFKEAIKVFKVKKGMCIRFLKNERRKCILVCKDPKCRYRVYSQKWSKMTYFK